MIGMLIRFYGYTYGQGTNCIEELKIQQIRLAKVVQQVSTVNEEAVNDYGVCIATGIATCHVYGDPHFYTFDKVMHSFMGTCTYVLVDVRDKRSVIPFTIKGKTEDRGQRGATYLKEVYIDIYDLRITLQKDRKTLVRFSSI